MQGNLANVTIYRKARRDDDEAGGAQYDPYSVHVTDGIRARIANRAPTLEMRAQGLGTDRFYDATIKPATTDVQANDLLIPDDGPFAHTRFLVTGVQKPSMMSLNSPRAHLKLQLERYDDGKTIEFL